MTAERNYGINLVLVFRQSLENVQSIGVARIFERGCQGVTLCHSESTSLSRHFQACHGIFATCSRLFG